MDLKDKTNEEICKLIVDEEISFADLTDAGICPTCFDKENNNILFGDNKDKLLYEDNLIYCMLVGNPRALGHAAIFSKKHYKILRRFCQPCILYSEEFLGFL